MKSYSLTSSSFDPVVTTPQVLLISIFFTFLIIFSPLKGIVYFLPYLLLILCMLLNSKIINRVILLLVIVISNFIIYNYYLDLIAFNFFFALLTYGSFVFCFCVPSQYINLGLISEKINRLVVIFLIVESVVGIGQALVMFLRFGTFDGSIGDAVTGTIGLLESTTSSSNAVFAINIAIFLTFVWCSDIVSKKTKLICLILGSLALVLTSVMHVILFYIGAVLSAVFLTYNKKILHIRNLKLLAFPAIVLFIVFATQERNLNRIESTYRLLEKNPKALITFRYLEKSSYDYNFLLFGSGLGQFVSRAGLISTGNYLKSNRLFDILGVKPSYTSIQIEMLYDLWVTLKGRLFRNSASATPWYSILSIISEIGILVSSIGLVIFLMYLKKITRTSFQIREKMFILIVSILILFLSLIENYLEYTQAIFIGILLIKTVESKNMLKSELVPI